VQERSGDIQEIRRQDGPCTHVPTSSSGETN